MSDNLWRIANLELWESGRDSDPVLLRVTEPLLTREEAANDPDLDAMRRVLVNVPDDDRFYSFYFHDEQLLAAFHAALGVTDDE